MKFETKTLQLPRWVTAALLIPLAVLATACPPAPRPDPRPGPDPIPSLSPAPIGAIDSPYGVTLDDVKALPAALRSWGALPVRPWVRVPFDPGNGPEYYSTTIKALLDLGFPVLGELLDSYDMPGCNQKCYEARAADYGDAFGASITYEVGNEINGPWLGTGTRAQVTAQVSAKVAAAFRILHGRGYRTAVTGYLCTYGNEPTMNAWLAQNLPADVRAGLDYALVSHYEGDCADSEVVPAPVDSDYWGKVFRQLGTDFPRAELGMGETGIGNACDDNGENCKEMGTPAERAAYATRYFTLIPTAPVPRYRVRGFWWFKEDILPGGGAVWNAIAGAMR